MPEAHPGLEHFNQAFTSPIGPGVGDPETLLPGSTNGEVEGLEESVVQQISLKPGVTPDVPPRRVSVRSVTSRSTASENADKNELDEPENQDLLRSSALRNQFLLSTIKAMRHHQSAWVDNMNTEGDFPKISSRIGCDQVIDAEVTHAEHLERACLLDHNGAFIRKWDSVTMIGLSWTAVVTPVEVAFVDREVRTLFVLNQIITLIFFIDMILQFFLPYETLGVDGIHIVTNRYHIASHYLKGWFAIDVLSIIPLDSVGNITGNTAMEKLKVMRFVRLLRLLKMMRLFRASRILTRWQTRLAFPYSLQSMLKFAMMLIFGAHWIGCCWGMVGLSIDGYSWVDALQDTKPRGMQVAGDPLNLYLASLHFAIMTITSIGYGDIYPQQAVEYVFVVILQCLGGMLWAYSMGEVMGVISNLNPAGTVFKQTMDQLNSMMRDRQLPGDMQRNLRSFFLQAKELHQAERYSELLMQMSPLLQGQVARVTSNRWISRVWYLRPRRLKWTSGSTTECLPVEQAAGVSDVFVARLAVTMKSRVYSQSEVVRSDNILHVLSRGTAQLHRKMLKAGDVWGEDFILECRALRRASFVLARTFIEVQEVSGATFRQIVDSCAVYGDDRVIRRAVIKLAFMRGFVLFAKKFEETQKKFLESKNAKKRVTSVFSPRLEGGTDMLDMTDSMTLTRMSRGDECDMRQLVREEVQKVLREELSCLRELHSPRITEA